MNNIPKIKAWYIMMCLMFFIVLDFTFNLLGKLPLESGERHVYTIPLDVWLTGGQFPNDHPIVYFPLLAIGKITQNITLSGELTTMLGICTCIILMYFVVRKYFGEMPGIFSMGLAYSSPLLFFQTGALLQQLYGFIPILAYIYLMDDKRRSIQLIVIPCIIVLAALTHLASLATVLGISILAGFIWRNKYAFFPLIIGLLMIPVTLIYPTSIKITAFLNPYNPAFIFQQTIIYPWVEWFNFSIPNTFLSLGYTFIAYGVVALITGVLFYLKTRDKIILFNLIFLAVLLAPITHNEIYVRMMFLTWLPASIIFASTLLKIRNNMLPLIFIFLMFTLTIIFTRSLIWFVFPYMIVVAFIIYNTTQKFLPQQVKLF